MILYFQGLPKALNFESCYSGTNVYLPSISIVPQMGAAYGDSSKRIFRISFDFRDGTTIIPVVTQILE
jgi:hypothetical protein